jgi:hypothetical protein
MKSPRHVPHRSLKSHFLFASVALALFCFAQMASAQSGRRNKTAPSPPTPVAEEPKTEPTPTPQSNAKAAARTSIIVGKDKFATTNFALDSYANYALDACIDRINETKSLEARGGSDMSRKDAIDRAKKGDAYVLLIEVKDEQDGQGNISINYSLYIPETAKVLTSGYIYLGTKSVGKGGVGVGVPSVSRQMPLQYQMKAGGPEVADRVVNKIGLPTRTGQP